MENETKKPTLHAGQITVAELIEKLKSMPQDSPVWHEGCDCWGCADDVELQNDGCVLITRNN